MDNQRSRLLRAMRSIGVAVVTLCVVGVAVLMAGPRLLGWSGVVVLTGSMEPALDVGAVAFVEPTEPTAIGVGDVITFERPGSRGVQMTHRVVEVVDADALGFRTKGDANTLVDDWVVPAHRVVGKVRLAVPHLGGVVERLRDRDTYLLWVGVPAALVIAGEVGNIGRELRSRRRRGLAGSGSVSPRVPRVDGGDVDRHVAVASIPATDLVTTDALLEVDPSAEGLAIDPVEPHPEPVGPTGTDVTAHTGSLPGRPLLVLRLRNADASAGAPIASAAK